MSQTLTSAAIGLLATFLNCSAAEVARTSAESPAGYRGPLRNGIYPASNLLTQWPTNGPKLLWKYEELGPGWASATVVGDTVFCLGGAPTGRLHALELETGKLKWKEAYGPEFTSRFDGTRSTPNVSDGLVIFSSGKKNERSVYCYDAATGRRVWHVDGNKEFGGAEQGWGYNESPLVVGDLVVFTLRSKDNVTPPVVALDKRTGKVVWKASPEPGDLSAGDCSISLAGEGPNRILVATLWRAILALEVKTGKTLWSIPMKTGTVLTPTYRDGCLAVAVNGELTMLKLSADCRSFTELWRKTGKENIETKSQVVLLDGKVFGIGTIEETVEEIRTENGQEKRRMVTRKSPAWVCFERDTGRLLKAQACLCDGSVVAADGMVYIIEGGERAWRTPRMSLLKPTPDGFVCTGSFTPEVGTKELWVSPTIAAGRLFIRHGKLLACYNLRGALSAASSP